MTQEPDFAEVNPALWDASRQVLQHLGLDGEEFAGLITLDQLARAAAAKEAALPGQRPWDYAYGTACEFLYLNCQDPALPGYSLAFQWLRQHFYDWFRGQIQGDETTAEDLAADVVEIIVRRLGQVRFPTAFLAWAQQIARNHFKEYLSRKDRIKTVAPPAASADPAQTLDEVRALLKVTEAEIEDTSPGVNPETIALDHELRSQLLESIQAMRSNTKNSQLYRQIIVGFYFENKSIEELAELLDLTPTKVSKLKNQALLNLRKIWQKYEDQSNI